MKYRRVSFRRGFVMTARFAPDGSIVYGASWEDQPNEIFAAHPNNPESRPVGLTNADILAVAPNGELAVSLGRHFIGGWVTSGTLARVPSFGGAPRELAADVQDADWTPDGSALAVIRTEAERFVVEMPLGTRIYESPEWISHVRVSPKGDRIAFLQHDRWGDDSGRVVVIGIERRARSSSRTAITASPAWPGRRTATRSGSSAHHEGTGRDIVALSMRGRERVVLPAAGRFTLNDIARDGRVLVAVESGRREMMIGTPRRRRAQSHLARLVVPGRHLARMARASCSKSRSARAATTPTRSTCARPTDRRRCVSAKERRAPSRRTGG